jgi:monoamine oxidase
MEKRFMFNKIFHALLVSSLALFASPSTLAEERVIVVGAGFAGLAAAKSLYSKGYDVVVLEAKDRIGGRIWTDRSSGFPMEMGASWIHGITNNPVYDLANDLNMEMNETNYEDTIHYDYDGSLVTPDPKSDIENLEVIEAYITAFLSSKYTDDLSLQEMMDTARELGDIRLEDRFYDHLVHGELELPIAMDADELSVQVGNDKKEFEGGDVLLPQGFDTIIEHLSTGLDIRLNTVVKSINQSTKGVRVATDNGTFKGDRVVVTLPVGVLKSGAVNFQPPLSPIKQRALRKLNSGSANKVWMKFPSVFWDTNELILHTSQNKGEYPLFFDFDGHTNEPVLMAFLAGTNGSAIEGKTDQQVTDEAMNVLKTLYGESIPMPSDVRVSRWGSDPYTKGSYSSLKPGGKPVHRIILAAPIDNRVFFAGEHTHPDFSSTVQGAYLSGLRAADEINSL